MGIKIFGKNIFQIYSHHIMCCEYPTIKQKVEQKEGLTFRQIDYAHIDRELVPIGSTVTVGNLEKLLKKNEGRCEGFILSNESGTPVGTVWVLYRNADDLEYRIRNIDAYLFDVYVNKDYRGKGYAGQMILRLTEYLSRKKIETCYLAVSVKNNSAINAYEKAGFRQVKDVRFARILKINVPYVTL